MTARIVLAGLLLATLASAGASWTGYRLGLERGELNVSAQRDRQAVEDLAAMIDRHRELVAEADRASERLLRAAAARAQHDRATTATLQEVLNETAGLRGQCVFDDRVMRELQAARERAAAAAAGGLYDAVPGAGRAQGE